MERQMRMLNLRNLKGAHLSLVVLALSVLALAGCTKTVPYEEEYKNQVYSKSDIDTGGEYLFTASMANASSDDENARPFWFAESKRVKLSISEKQLRVEETVLDQRFEANDGNKKVVLEIPVEHIEFECAKDSFGQCTNKEAKNDKIDWSKKTNFKIDLAGAKASQLEILPILMEKDFTGGFCYQDISSRVVSQEIAADAINFQIERNYKNLCSGGRTTASTNVKAVFHYSMVRVSSVLTKDFVPRTYPKKDENTFGYFYTERYPRDIDKNETESGRLALKNHWSPDRTVVDFHLSDEFNKPENKRLKELSYTAVERVNKGLKEAGAKFKIDLHEPSGKVPGDIRNSMIVLVEDPYAAGPLGYGPQTEDPVTGEIISARTIMYSGVFETIIKIYYEDLLRANAEEKSAEGRVKKSKRATSELIAKIQAQMKMEKSQGKGLVDKATLARVGSDKVKLRKTLDLTQSTLTASSGQQAASANIEAAIGFQSAEKIARDYTRNKDKSFEYLTMLNRMAKGEVDHKGAKNEGIITPAALTDSDVQERKLTYLRDVKNCAYTPNMARGAGSVNYGKLKKLFKDKFEVDGLKPWENMTRAEKKSVIAFFMEEMYLPTLVHELGHNLGLRHNFAGSEDKSNFPTTEELAEVQDDRNPVSSSVMDYVDDNVALKHMGKYDVAALKYAYGRQVELVEYSKNPETCEQQLSDDGRKVIKRSHTISTSQTIGDLQSIIDLIQVDPADEEKPCGALKSPNLEELNKLEAKCEKIKQSGQLVDIEAADLALTRKCQVIADVRASGLSELQSLQGLELKDYGFCTDESTGINAGCRRFDLGTNMTEIAQNLIESYDNRYWVRNLRRDRVDFSLFDDPSYYNRTRSYFYDMRLMLEVVERIKNSGLAYSSKRWESGFLKDLRSAAVLTGEKLLDVATTPTKYCLIAAVDGSDQFVMPLEDLARQISGGDGVDCWDIESSLPSIYAIAAQAGKNFNAAKSPTSENAYADQVDVRGYWMDKRAAISMLTRRSVGVSSLDRGGENYLDLPELRTKINDAFVAMVSNEMKKVVKFELADGTSESIEFSFDTFASHTIEKPLHPYIAGRLGISDEKQPLTQMLVNAIPNNMRDYIGKADSERTFVKQYVVSKYDATNLGNLNINGKIFVDVGDVRYVAGPENTIAAKLITDVKDKQTVFVKMSTLGAGLDAAKVSDEDIAVIFKVKAQVDTILDKAKTPEEEAELIKELMPQAVKLVLTKIKVDTAEITAEKLNEIITSVLTEGDEDVLKVVKSGQSQFDFVTSDFSVKLLRIMQDRVM